MSEVERASWSDLTISGTIEIIMISARFSILRLILPVSFDTVLFHLKWTSSSLYHAGGGVEKSLRSPRDENYQYSGVSCSPNHYSCLRDVMELETGKLCSANLIDFGRFERALRVQWSAMSDNSHK